MSTVKVSTTFGQITLKLRPDAAPKTAKVRAAKLRQIVNFPLKHAQKDVRLAVNLGASLGLGLPVAAATDVTMLASMAKGFGDYDFAAVYEAQKKAPTTGGAMPLSSVAVLCVASGLLGAWIALKMKK